jgi:mannosyl-3-phosphoglycerate phosphatase
MDGVLRQPHTPSFVKAANVLKQLEHDDAVIVLCSGKTRAEIQFIQQKLDITEPFLCENGGAVLIPAGYFGFDVPNARALSGYQAVEFGRPYTDVVELLHRTADRVRVPIVGFSDMSIEDVARECRLPLLQARLAKLREYEEPFHVTSESPSARTRLFKALEAASLRCTSGGAFDLVGAPVQLDAGVGLLRRLYQRSSAALTTIGLAHALPEDSLLRLVDYPVVFPEEESNDVALDVVDWAEAVVDMVQEVRRKDGAPALVARDSRLPSSRLH